MIYLLAWWPLAFILVSLSAPMSHSATLLRDTITSLTLIRSTANRILCGVLVLALFPLLLLVEYPFYILAVAISGRE